MQELLKELRYIIDKYNLRLKHKDGIIALYSNESTNLVRAMFGLDELIELSYTTAEHHPYWGILYNTTEIIRSILENWDKELSKDELDELRWRVDELKNILNNLGINS